MLFAMLAVPMFALVGMSVDYARTINAREAMQLSLDAAVLAAANVKPGEDRILVAQKFFQANLKKVIANAEAKFSVHADGTIVGKAGAVVNTPVIGLINNNQTVVGTASEARPASTVQEESVTTSAASVKPCVHVMDQNGTSFRLDQNSLLNASDCEVRARSNHFWAVLDEKNSSNVKFKKIKTKGYSNVTSQYGVSQFHIVDAPNRVMENSQDSSLVGTPYDKDVSAISRQITVGNCTNANTGKTYQNTIVNPGTYCGNTRFINVTFLAGIYNIASKGNTAGVLNMSGNLNGQAGVTFNFADNKAYFGSYTGNDYSKLKPAVSGVTKGILFMESSNRGQTWSMAVLGDRNEWTGLVYLPSANLSFDDTDFWTLNIAMAANQLTIRNTEETKINAYAWTPYGQSEPIMVAGDSNTNTKEGWLFK